MNGLVVVGAMVAGGLVGWCGGLWWGFRQDTGDFPIYPAFTGPIGAAIGIFVGGGAAALLS